LQSAAEVVEHKCHADGQSTEFYTMLTILHQFSSWNKLAPLAASSRMALLTTTSRLHLARSSTPSSLRAGFIGDNAKTDNGDTRRDGASFNDDPQSSQEWDMLFSRMYNGNLDHLYRYSLM